MTSLPMPLPTPTTERRSGRARLMMLTIALMSLAACSDSPLAPQQQSIDRVAAARVVPAVTDARTRLTLGIENAVVRERVAHDLAELEHALINGDGQKARFHVRVLGTVIQDYRTQQGALTTDGADMSGIILMLHAVSQVIDAGFAMPLFTS